MINDTVYGGRQRKLPSELVSPFQRVYSHAKEKNIHPCVDNIPSLLHTKCRLEPLKNQLTETMHEPFRDTCFALYLNSLERLFPRLNQAPWICTRDTSLGPLEGRVTPVETLKLTGRNIVNRLHLPTKENLLLWGRLGNYKSPPFIQGRFSNPQILRNISSIYKFKFGELGKFKIVENWKEGWIQLCKGGKYLNKFSWLWSLNLENESSLVN